MSNIDNPVAALGANPDDAVYQLYGYMAWALDIPEIGDILRSAAANPGMSTDQLKAQLEKTNWWQTTAQSEKQWQQLMAEDPATAQQQIGNKAAQIRTELTQNFGIVIDDYRLRQVAEQSLRWNWSDDQLKGALDAELRRVPNLLQSKIGVDYKALADQYGVPMSDATISTWAAHGVSGVHSQEEFRQYLVQQASMRYADNAPLQQFMAKGGTVGQFFDPYKQYAAQILGINPDEISFSDPKWTAAINARIDDKGTIGPMTTDQWIQYIKSNPIYGYSKTSQAQAESAGLQNTIGSLFGKAAPT